MFAFTLFLSFWARIMLLILYPMAAAHATPTGNEASTYYKLSTKNEQLSWSTDRRLTWEDFKGQPDDSKPHHALTAANISVTAGCKKNQFTYTVTCVFLPQQSWSKRKNSDALLAHEQLHFDLTEVHARQLRRDLEQISCGKHKAKVNRVVQRAFKRWKEEQELFDKSSRHGVDKEVQQVWATKIETRLEKLAAYQ